MIIEIKGVQFENKGAELMLQAIINKLSTELPSARICLAHNKNSPYLKRARVGALQKVNLRKYIFDLNRLFYFVPSKIRNYFITRFGIVSEADVDVILDTSGFAYGDQWPDLILRQVANEVARIRRLGKHYIFMPQSLGPFSGSVNQQFARKAFSEASLVFAREPSSYDHVLALVNEKSHVHQAPDFTNLLDPDILQEYAKYQDHIILIPNSKMLSKKNKDIWWRENYVSTLAFLANKVLEGGEKVIILNHSGAEDAPLCDEINCLLTTPCDIVEPKDALAVKALIAKGKLVICSRFHGCVSALSQAIPCIATGWSHKYVELFGEYESKDALLPSHISETELMRLLNEYLKESKTRKLNLVCCAKKYKQQSEAMWQRLIAIIK